VEVHYKRKRDNPVPDRQPKMHMSPDNDRPQKTRAVFTENRVANGDTSWTKFALCHKCGKIGHIRPLCEWEGEDKHLERLLLPRKKGTPLKKESADDCRNPCRARRLSAAGGTACTRTDKPRAGKCNTCPAGADTQGND
jgi:hypothetical protein